MILHDEILVNLNIFFALPLKHPEAIKSKTSDFFNLAILLRIPLVKTFRKEQNSISTLTLFPSHKIGNEEDIFCEGMTYRARKVLFGLTLASARDQPPCGSKIIFLLTANRT